MVAWSGQRRPGSFHIYHDGLPEESVSQEFLPAWFVR